MLKIRYNNVTKQLSGWTDKEADFDSLVVREGEKTALLDIAKPDADDYEYFAFVSDKLVPSGKPKPIPIQRRDLATEIDEIKAKIADYDELKAKVKALEKK